MGRHACGKEKTQCRYAGRNAQPEPPMDFTGNGNLSVVDDGSLSPITIRIINMK